MYTIRVRNYDPKEISKQIEGFENQYEQIKEKFKNEKSMDGDFYKSLLLKVLHLELVVGILQEQNRSTFMKGVIKYD